jgi:hypothetical protein
MASATRKRMELRNFETYASSTKSHTGFDTHYARGT